MTKAKTPIKSGWRGNLNGYVEDTDRSHIGVSEVTVKLDYETASIGRLIDHHSANNGGRNIIK